MLPVTCYFATHCLQYKFDKTIDVKVQVKILIIGLTAAGADSLPPNLIERILATDVLAGGRRQLAYFPDFSGQAIPITAEVESVAEQLRLGLADNQQAVVLASGDPLCYGIGASLRRYFPAEALEIIPAPTAFQLAFAALSEPWHGAALLSAHARPLADVVASVLSTPKAAILTDNQQTPAVIAKALLDAGLSPQSECAVCENLGGSKQRVVRTVLGKVGLQEYAPLNVFVIWPISNLQSPTLRVLISPPDHAYSTSANQITKREIRALSLAELALQPGEIMWDIGAGSGSVGIETAQMQPTATVYAIEKRAELIAHLQENLRRFPAANYHWTEGVAPADIAYWPDPHAVFIGGSGGQLETIIDTVQQRLHPNGRLVINLATLENLNIARKLLPDAHVNQIQINRGVPILEMLRFESLNPIFIVTWQKNSE